MNTLDLLLVAAEQGAMQVQYLGTLFTQTASSFKTGDFNSQSAMIKMVSTVGAVWWATTKLTYKKKQARKRIQSYGWPPRLTIEGD